MRGHQSYPAIILVLIGAIIVCGCIAAGGDDDRISANGTVTYVDLEGGFYGIIADGGERYLPIGLEDRYRVDGMRIAFSGRIVPDAVTLQQWGTPIEILDIPWVDSQPGAGIANPAAAWCIEQGHTYEIRKNSDGSEYGVCIFANGTEVDAWDYYRQTH
ncbi:MAG: DUF333 domain-containing protein [Methanoculleus sp.]|jgi:putative hemolysin|nr:DUF333 domain-containing protein [Methanomicrobiales archaeon]